MFMHRIIPLITPKSFIRARILSQFRTKTSVAVGLGAAAGLGVPTLANYARRNRLVRNDSIAVIQGNKQETKARIDYHQLTYGSFLGMIAGYIFGQVSRMLVGWVVVTLMGSEYLKQAGYIDTKPLEATIHNFCRKTMHLDVFVEDPSFKYSFGAAFLIAAVYA